MHNTAYDRDQVHEYLNMYLQDRLESIQVAADQAGNPEDRGRTAEEERAITLDRYQHRIWQLKDRLSCQVYGPHTEGMVDAFMARFGILAPKTSREYVWILRKVLQTEIRLYTILMQRMSIDHGQESLFQRKVPGQDGLMTIHK
jgi:hypothetical protein